MRTLAPDAVVAGRYRVLRFIAEGAMGEVYAVEDLALRERVALKLIRAEYATRPQSAERFRRELLLARRVTHPNVCRVFDLGLHSGTGPEGSPREMPFFTMELLEGLTLREHLMRHGRLAPDEALLLAGQMAAALDAAHAAGVIHRDFKSGNVMRVQAPGAPGGVRVAVTDFGLAWGVPREGEAAASCEGAFLGSPGYMSPEQVACRPVTPASDVYSFGVVLFELVTGRLPFVADVPLTAAFKRLHEPPPAPRTLVPELAPVWDDVLLRCLARTPESRFTSASQVVSALREGSRESDPPERAAARRWRWPRMTLVTTSLAVASLGATLHPPAGGPAWLAASVTSPGVVAPVARRSVAVLAPRNLSARPDAAWLSTALVEMLSAELTAGEHVRVLSGEDVARMDRELALPEGESLAADTLERIRVHSGADLVLTGGYLLLAQEGRVALRLDLRLQESASGETVAQVTETGTERDLLALVSRVGEVLRVRLGMAPLTTEQVRSVRSSLPARPDAARLYAEGLAALRRWDAATAVVRLERVVELEPGFPLAHSALAVAFKQLFLDERASEAARRAYALSGRLSREERLLVEARHHEARASWGHAIEAYRTLFDFFPDNVEYGTALVSAQVSAGQNREALATLDSLRRLPPPLSEDARIDLVAALATSAAGDFAAARRHAAGAVARARRAGQHLMVAHALISESFALRNQGESARAVELMEEAERLFLTEGDRGGALRAMLGRAIALTDQVRFHDAEAVYADALRAAREFRGTTLEAETLVNAGWLRCHLGYQAEALRFTEDARALFQRLGLHLDFNSSTIQLGMVMRRRGELDAAQRLLEKGAEAARSTIQDDYHEAWAHYELGLLLLDRGEPTRAREPLERALALRRERGMGAFVEETELALARLALAEERPEEALSRAESARSAYAAQRTVDKEGLASALVASALLARGDVAGARLAMDRARALAGNGENAFIAAEVTLTAARLAARAGTPEEQRVSAGELDALVARATTGGMAGVALEARLARVELVRSEGGASLAESRAIQAEADRLGYAGLARRARMVAPR
ncbi:protein kinase domain-containing protein [Pyxidicoccus trucidator]|uniref:protein kinase domain-containing protein n=1 Tax=Pyxidicoccus trucidator TaxID=2709662 RepID=UPI0013D953A1|nr:protein kinase [Pyxidicoccus trucidator]